MTRPADEELARVAQVVELTGHPFRDVSLVCDALTHASYANEHGVRDYERLEFLGDALVNLHAAIRLSTAHPDAPEGVLTNLRQRVIETHTLGARGAQLGLRDLVWRGRGDTQKGPASDDLVGDAVEALFAALFLDGGFEATVAFADLVLSPLVDAAAEGPAQNPVNRLQELTQARYAALPSYRFEHSGPAHQPHHVAHVWIGERRLTSGEGKSKSDARKNAAQLAIAILEREAEPAP